MGSSSVILKSNDSGETWNVIDLETQVHVKDFQFIDDTIIYVIGDSYIGAGENLTSKLIKSSDNGDTWDSITSFTGKQLLSLWFFNNDSGMVAGSHGIYRTVDAGDDWDTVWSFVQFGYRFGSLEQLYFPTDQIGYAIGTAITQNNDDLTDYLLLKTYNSGITWDTIKTFRYSPTAIHFLNQDTGFIGTGTGSSIILKTMNGGYTWNETQITEYYNTVFSIQFISNMKGFAAGAPSAFIPEAPTSFFVSKTNDGGITWESYDTIGIPLNSIYFLNDTAGFVSGSYSLIMKSNGIISGLPPDYPWYLVGGDFIEDKDLFNSRIRVFPNPTFGPLILELNDASASVETVRVLNSSGQILVNMKPVSGCGLIQLDLSDFVEGIYLVQVFFSVKTEFQKVIKK